MPMSAKQVLKEALDLPEKERAELVRDLLDSFGSPPQTERTDEEWLTEIERRARAATRPEGAESGPGLLERLQEIEIDAPEDFATNFDLYVSGEKGAGSDLR